MKVPEMRRGISRLSFSEHWVQGSPLPPTAQVMCFLVRYARNKSRNTNGSMPPWRTYSTSSGVSTRRVTSNSFALPPDSARTFTV
jgi:hypothetical protein